MGLENSLNFRRSKGVSQERTFLAEETAFRKNKLENSERDGDTRSPDLPLEKPICGSGSNS